MGGAVPSVISPKKEKNEKKNVKLDHMSKAWLSDKV